MYSASELSLVANPEIIKGERKREYCLRLFKNDHLCYGRIETEKISEKLVPTENVDVT